MAAAVGRRPTAAMVPHPWCRGIQQLADMLRNRFTLLKLEKQYLLLLILLLCARRVDGDDAVAADDAPSCVWAVSGGSDATGPSYGPSIDIVR